jgi:hypothetical protein
MNERIKELMVQVCKEQGIPFTVEHNRAYMLDNFSEKFAELIVRECCIALNPMLRDMISRGQGVDMIKLHFGMNPKETTTRMLDTAIDQMEKQLAEKKHDS